MKETSEICSICKKREIKQRGHKTCGNPTCQGKYAEKTKNRIERQKSAESYIRKCADSSRSHWGIRNVCIVCGDTLSASLTTHHFDKKKSPNDTATLCGSCHRIFDSTDSGLRELRMRRRRHYKYNLKNACAWSQTNQ